MVRELGFNGARVCDPQRVRRLETSPLNPNAFHLAKPLRVTDPRSDQTNALLIIEADCLVNFPPLFPPFPPVKKFQFTNKLVFFSFVASIKP